MPWSWPALSWRLWEMRSSLTTSPAGWLACLACWTYPSAAPGQAAPPGRTATGISPSTTAAVSIAANCASEPRHGRWDVRAGLRRMPSAARCRPARCWRGRPAEGCRGGCCRGRLRLGQWCRPRYRLRRCGRCSCSYATRRPRGASMNACSAAAQRDLRSAVLLPKIGGLLQHIPIATGSPRAAAWLR